MTIKSFTKGCWKDQKLLLWLTDPPVGESDEVLPVICSWCRCSEGPLCSSTRPRVNCSREMLLLIVPTCTRLMRRHFLNWTPPPFEVPIKTDRTWSSNLSIVRTDTTDWGEGRRNNLLSKKKKKNTPHIVFVVHNITKRSIDVTRLDHKLLHTQKIQTT